MRDMTEDLVGLVPPPEEPDPAGGGLPESVVLPEDYLHFVVTQAVRKTAEQRKKAKGRAK